MWLTNKKTGARFNTDWYDEDQKRKYQQLEGNKEIGDKLNSTYASNQGFKKTWDSFVDHDRINRNAQNMEPGKAYVIYKDNRGYRIEVTKSHTGGHYTVALKDKDGNYAAHIVRLNYYDTAKPTIDDLISKASEHAEKLNRYPDDPFRGELGEKKEISDPIAHLKEMAKRPVINPHYDEKVNGRFDYNNNCAICCAAAIAQMKGYNVEAGIQDDHYNWFTSKAIFQPDLSATRDYVLPSSKYDYGIGKDQVSRYIDGKIKQTDPNMSLGDRGTKVSEAVDSIQWSVRSAETTQQTIEKTVKNWGDGGYGTINVSWKGRDDRHAMIIYNDKGSIHIWDPQDNTFIDLDVLMTKVSANNTEVIRFDTATVREAADRKIEHKGNRYLKVKGG